MSAENHCDRAIVPLLSAVQYNPSARPNDSHVALSQEASYPRGGGGRQSNVITEPLASDLKQHNRQKRVKINIKYKENLNQKPKQI